MARKRLRFEGWIAGLGTAEGTRVVVRHWLASPFGPMTDLMVETGDGSDPLARRLLPGVRTRGSAGGGRREWYGARDLHPIVAAQISRHDRSLGALRPVEPPVRFGSVPRRPCLVRVTTTVQPA